MRFGTMQRRPPNAPFRLKEFAIMAILVALAIAIVVTVT
jgi:hypothetical protein